MWVRISMRRTVLFESEVRTDSFDAIRAAMGARVPMKRKFLSLNTLRRKKHAPRQETFPARKKPAQSGLPAADGQRSVS